MTLLEKELQLVARDGRAVAVADSESQARSHAEALCPNLLPGEFYWTGAGKLFKIAPHTKNVSTHWRWTGWEIRPVLHAGAA